MQSRVSATAVSGFVIPLCFMTIIIKFIERRSFFSLQFTTLLFSVQEILEYCIYCFIQILKLCCSLDKSKVCKCWGAIAPTQHLQIIQI